MTTSEQTWEAVIAELQTISNPPALKQLYIDCVEYLSQHEISKNWQPELSAHFFLRIRQKEMADNVPVLTFESPDATNQLEAVIIYPDTREKERIGMDSVDFRVQLDRIVRKMAND